MNICLIKVKYKLPTFIYAQEMGMIEADPYGAALTVPKLNSLPLWIIG